MPHYRLYRLAPHSGHFAGVEEMHAADDVSAIHEIQQRRFDVSVELWCGGKKVTQIDGPPEGAASVRRGSRRRSRRGIGITDPQIAGAIEADRAEMNDAFLLPVRSAPFPCRPPNGEPLEGQIPSLDLARE